MSQCPVCNGLFSIHEICSRCGHTMNDMGSREDYYGPYRPYMSDEDEEFSCLHVLYCSECGLSIAWPVQQMR